MTTSKSRPFTHLTHAQLDVITDACEDYASEIWQMMNVFDKSPQALSYHIAIELAELAQAEQRERTLTIQRTWDE